MDVMVEMSNMYHLNEFYRYESNVTLSSDNIRIITTTLPAMLFPLPTIPFTMKLLPTTEVNPRF